MFVIGNNGSDDFGVIILAIFAVNLLGVLIFNHENTTPMKIGKNVCELDPVISLIILYMQNEINISDRIAENRNCNNFKMNSLNSLVSSNLSICIILRCLIIYVAKLNKFGK